MGNYLYCLFKQYCDAKGINPDCYDEVYKTEFHQWIYQNSYLLKTYLDYLLELGYPYLDGDTVEIGKGKHDSLSKYGMSIVSPFASTLGQKNSSFYVIEGLPLILGQNELTIPVEHTILTHNPYSTDRLSAWCQVHNKGNRNISIGMFGKIDDEDASKKIDTLSSLTRELNDDYTFMLDTYNGNYFCTLNSNRHVKKLKKTLI